MSAVELACLFSFISKHGSVCKSLQCLTKYFNQTPLPPPLPRRGLVGGRGRGETGGPTDAEITVPVAENLQLPNDLTLLAKTQSAANRGKAEQRIKEEEKDDDDDINDDTMTTTRLLTGTTRRQKGGRWFQRGC